MAMYFLAFFIIAMSGIAFKSHNRKFLAVSLVVLSLLEGFRASSVGTDTLSYINTFHSGIYTTEEYLFRLLTDFVRCFTNSSVIYLTFLSFVTNGLVIYAIYRDSDNSTYSVFVYISMLFYFISFNAVRQSIAIALVLNAFVSAKNKKLLSFLALSLAAFLFHQSALVVVLYLPFFFLKKESKTFVKKSIYYAQLSIVVLLTIIVMFNFDFFFNLGLKIIPGYEKYTDVDSKYILISGGTLQIIVYSCIFLAFLLFTKNSYDKFVFLVPLSLCVIFAFATYKIAYLERFMYYFEITTVLSIPYLLKNSVLKKNDLVVLVLGVSACLVTFFFYLMSGNFMRVANYSFFFEQ